MSNTKNIYHEVTGDDMKLFIGYTLNEVTDTAEGTILEFTKVIGNVIIGRNAMITDEQLFITKDYVVDVIGGQI